MLKYKRIHAGWLIDGKNPFVHEDVWILVDQGLINAVAPYVSTQATHLEPSSVLDLKEYTLMPPLVDCHVHLFMSGTTDIAARRQQLEADYDEQISVISTHLEQHFSCGVRALRDGGDSKGIAQRYQREFLRPDDELKPVSTPDSSRGRLGLHVKVAGKAWHANGRYGKLIARSPAPGQSLSEALRRESGLPESIRPDHVKIVNSGVNSLLHFGKETLPQFSLEELSAAVDEAKRQKLKVMVHANGKLPVRIAVETGCHSIEHGYFMGDENLARMRDRQTVWVPTIYTMRAYAAHLSPKSREAETAKRNLEDQLNQLRKAREIGVLVALGTDAGSLGVHHGSAVKEELRLFLEAGYTVFEALQSASKIGAGLLGIPDMGTLSPGRPASWIAVKGDPSGLPDSLSCVIQTE